ncbi:hypothetical protein AgCh_036169 [Apium graveolens]
MGYIDGTLPCPSDKQGAPQSSELSKDPLNLSPTTSRKLWLRQDRLILQAFMAGNIAPLISSSATASESWTKLEVDGGFESSCPVFQRERNMVKKTQTSLNYMAMFARSCTQQVEEYRAVILNVEFQTWK